MKTTKLKFRIESENRKAVFFYQDGSVNKKAMSFYRAYDKKFNEIDEKYMDDDSLTDEDIRHMCRKEGYNYQWSPDLRKNTVINPEGVLIINRDAVINSWDDDDMGTPLPQEIVEAVMIEY
jgi:hypothetical protein